MKEIKLYKFHRRKYGIDQRCDVLEVYGWNGRVKFRIQTSYSGAIFQKLGWMKICDNLWERSFCGD